MRVIFVKVCVDEWRRYDPWTRVQLSAISESLRVCISGKLFLVALLKWNFVVFFFNYTIEL